MLHDEWLNSWDKLTMEEQQSLIDSFPGDPISRTGWITEQVPFFRDMIELLSCRVVSKHNTCMISCIMIQFNCDTLMNQMNDLCCSSTVGYIINSYELGERSVVI